MDMLQLMGVMEFQEDPVVVVAAAVAVPGVLSSALVMEAVVAEAVPEVREEEAVMVEMDRVVHSESGSWFVRISQYTTAA